MGREKNLYSWMRLLQPFVPRSARDDDWSTYRRVTRGSSTSSTTAQLMDETGAQELSHGA